ncbi:hypothetical protein MMC29_003112 [Sticta canariensis]|nr:hypothetical protein [Sticta canariensis]
MATVLGFITYRLREQYIKALVCELDADAQSLRNWYEEMEGPVPDFERPTVLCLPVDVDVLAFKLPEDRWKSKSGMEERDDLLDQQTKANTAANSAAGRATRERVERHAEALPCSLFISTWPFPAAVAAAKDEVELKHEGRKSSLANEQPILKVKPDGACSLGFVGRFDDRHLVSCGSDAAIALRKLASLNEEPSTTYTKEAVARLCMAASPTGSCFAIGDQQSYVKSGEGSGRAQTFDLTADSAGPTARGRGAPAAWIWDYFDKVPDPQNPGKFLEHGNRAYRRCKQYDQFTGYREHSIFIEATQSWAPWN